MKRPPGSNKNIGESLFRVLAEPERALLRSQGGSGAGACTPDLSNMSSHVASTLHSSACYCCVVFVSLCRCPPPTAGVAVHVDSRGHHRAACARAGVLGRRGFAVESAAARICREGGARVTDNVMIRDMDLAAPNPGDARRLEIVADGLPLFREAHSW